jgi:hypothetical protein
LALLLREDVFPAHSRMTTSIADSGDEHGMAPLLDEAVAAGNVAGDHRALVHLSMRSLECAADTRATLAGLGVVLDTADSLGVDVVVFKGLAISTRWYPKPELRPAVDIDVFVNPDQSDRLGELVETLAPDSQSRSTIDAMVAEGRVFEYSLAVDGVAVDVHLDPMNMVVATRQRELMWQRTELISIGDGLTVRTLDLELSIIQALLHLFRDNFADLLHVYDVRLMIDAGPDWDFIESFAAAEGWTDLIRFSLGVVCDLLDRPSPLPRDLTRINRLLIDAIWPDRILLAGTESLAKSFRRQSFASYLITGRRRDVTRAMLHRFFPARSVIDDRYPGCDCPYPVALLQWRRSQRAGIRHGKQHISPELPHETV